MSVPAVETSCMEHKTAISCRRLCLLTLLVADRWQEELESSNLLHRYKLIPVFIRQGAHAGILQIARTFTPMNKESTQSLPLIFHKIIQSEFNKGRYFGLLLGFEVLSYLNR